MKRSMIKQATALLLLIGISIGARAASAFADELILADGTACKKPRLPPPPLMKETYERYNIQRRYIDLDGSGTCVLMEFWVERLSGSDSPGMRTLGHRFLHVFDKRWVPFETDLRLFPFLMRSPKTGAIYLVVAPDKDIDVVAGTISPEAFVRGSWKTDDPTTVHTYSLLPVSEGRSHIFRALAAQLEQRTPAAKQTMGERQRIRSLLFRAAEAEKGISSAPLP